MADELEMAFLEGRMSANDEGGLAVLIADPDEEDTYYKLNMTSRDGTMSVWAEGSDGEKVEYGVGDGWEDEDRVGYFGIPVDGGEARERGRRATHLALLLPSLIPFFSRLSCQTSGPRCSFESFQTLLVLLALDRCCR